MLSTSRLIDDGIFPIMRPTAQATQAGYKLKVTHRGRRGSIEPGAKCNVYGYLVNDADFASKSS